MFASDQHFALVDIVCKCLKGNTAIGREGEVLSTVILSFMDSKMSLMYSLGLNSEMNSLHILTSYFFNMHFNNMPSMPTTPE